MIQYNNTMEGTICYLAANLDEKLDLEQIAQTYAYTGEYYATYFSSYFSLPYYELLRRVRENKGERPCRKVYYESEKFIRGYIREVEKDLIKVSFKTIRHAKIVDLEKIHIPDEYKDDPLSAWEKKCRAYQEHCGKSVKIASLWWYDNELWQRFSIGKLCYSKEEPTDFPIMEKGFIPLKNNEYVIFRKKLTAGQPFSDDMKSLIHYAHGTWFPEHKSYKITGFCLQMIHDTDCYYYVPVQKKKTALPTYEKHSVEIWTKYIDDHITENFNVEELSEKFGYSVRQFKRVFNEVYGISVSDYIRRHRLEVLMEELRQGKDYKSIAELYGFFSYKGFKKAFIREFGVSPKEYCKDQFEEIDLKKYREENMGKIRVRFTNLKEIKLLAHTEIGVQGDDVDIPAQMQYWLNKDYPSNNKRSTGNMKLKDDKIAMWYHPENLPFVDYVIGSVVDHFPDDIGEDEIPIVINGGKYAIFETSSGLNLNVEQTLRMFSRCVFYGWMIDNKDIVEWYKFTFERYVGNKIYIYVGLKEEERELRPEKEDIVLDEK